MGGVRSATLTARSNRSQPSGRSSRFDSGVFALFAAIVSDSSNMTDEHVFAFGHIILQWGRFEMALEQTIRRLVRMPSFDGMVVTTNINYQQKKKIIGALGELPFNRLAPASIADLERVMKEGDNQNAVRNDVAHGLWENGKRPRSITAVGMKAQGKIKLRGKKTNPTDYTADDLMEVARKIYYLTEEVLAFNESLKRKRRKIRSRASSP